MDEYRVLMSYVLPALFWRIVVPRGVIGSTADSESVSLGSNPGGAAWLRYAQVNYRFDVMFNVML